MPITHLVVSRPPFRDGIAPAVAPLIGKAIYETKVFLKYSLPEILKVCPAADAAEAAAAPFRAAGMDVDVVPVEALTALPRPAPVAAFDFGEDALALRFKEGGLLVPWRSARLLVVAAYEVESRAPTSSGVPEEMGKRFKKSGDRMGDAIGGVVGDVIGGAISNLGDELSGPGARRHTYVYQRADLYVWGAGEPSSDDAPSVRRARLDQTWLDYAGLGDRKRAVGVENWRTLLAELRERAPKLVVDDALVKTASRPNLIDGRLLSAHLAEEPDAVRQVVGDRDEFYSALLAWRETQKGEQQEEPEAEGEERSGTQRTGIVVGGTSGPDSRTSRPEAPPTARLAAATGSALRAPVAAAAAGPPPDRPPADARPDKMQAMLRAAAADGVQEQARRTQALERAQAVDWVLFLLALPIAVLSVGVVVAGKIFMGKIGTASKTLLGKDRTPTWLFGGGVILVLSFGFYEHWGDVDRPTIVKLLFPIMLGSGTAGGLLLLRRRARGA